MSRSSTSPYRPSGTRGGSESLEIMVKTLERENTNLVEQIKALRMRTQKVGELQDKIDLVLKHNTQLLNENERLAKLSNQRKSETEMWKNKFDSLSSNNRDISDLQIKRLLNENQKLKEEICQVQHVKNLQMNEIKNQGHLEIQNVKRTNLSSIEKCQLEIRKLKQYCDKKEYQISELNMKLVRLAKETDFEINKLRQEKDRLKNDILYEENQHKRQTQSLKSKFDYNFHSEIENMKKQHLNQMEALDYENSKLKEVINSKNLEIDQILIKNNKVKGNYEDSLSILQRENDEIKQKMLENQHIAQLELSNLRDKLTGIKESEMSMLSAGHLHQMDVLNREIRKMQEIIDDRNFQIQNLAKERNQMRLTSESEVLKAKTELEVQINENKDAEERHIHQVSEWRNSLDDKIVELRTLENYYKGQVQNAQLERDRFSALCESKQQQLSRERTSNSTNKRSLEQQTASLRQKLSSLQEELDRRTKRSSGDSDEAKRMSELKYKQYETKVKNQEDQNKQKDRLINELRENVRNLQEELQKIEEKVARLENTEKELRREAREAHNRWDAKEREYNTLIKDQIASMQRTKGREVEELRNIFENKIASLKHQIKENQREIDSKNRSINDLKQKYEDLVNKFEEIFAQRAAQKNLDIKVPGWLPETLATKSLFDVFLKNKVLQYCQ